MKTFILHDGGLGDALLSLPCLQRLKSASTHVHLAARADVARFLNEAGVIDDASSSGRALFSSLYSTVDDRLRSFLSHYDQAVVFTSGAQTDIAAAIRAVVPFTRAIKTIPPEGSSLHAASFRLSQLDPDARLEKLRPLLAMPQDKKKQAFTMLRDAGRGTGTHLIAVHPGSGGRMKCWPLERYFEVIGRLESIQDAFVIIFTGEAEEDNVRRSVDEFVRKRKTRLHAADLDLMTCASLLSHCRSYVGNDSGFSHLAGLMGCSSVVLFGPTDPAMWKPLGPRVNVISSRAFAPMTEIAAEEVVRSISPASYG